MSRPVLPYAAADVSTVARSLREQIAALDRLPSHLELLNMLARAAGRRNFQHFRADATAKSRLAETAVPEVAPADYQRVERAARHFDSQGRLLRWPARAGLAELCLWVLWSRIPSKEVFTDRQISEMLTLWHVFGDHALLRRALFDARLIDRNVNGSAYRRIEQKPPAELPVLLTQISP